MKKIKYFGGVLLSFAIAFIAARQFDALNQQQQLQESKDECFAALAKSEIRYIESLKALFPDNTSLTIIAQRYASANSGEEHQKFFEEIVLLGNQLTVQVDVSHPGKRKLLDEAAGALNRREATSAKCMRS